MFFTILTIILFISAVAIVGGILYVRQKVRRFNQELFGVDKIPAGDALEGFRAGMNDENLCPKSLSAQTSLLLPLIKKDFPEFNYNEMKERCKNLIFSYMRAIDENNADMMHDCTGELREIVANRIQSHKMTELSEHFTNAKCHRIEIARYEKNAGRCRIVFQAAMQSHHFMTKKGDSAFLQGSREQYEQSKFEVDLVYIQDRDIVEHTFETGHALNCPNCGAALTSVGAKKCEYCGSPIVEYNIRVWNFNRCEMIDH